MGITRRASRCWRNVRNATHHPLQIVLDPSIVKVLTCDKLMRDVLGSQDLLLEEERQVGIVVRIDELWQVELVAKMWMIRLVFYHKLEASSDYKWGTCLPSFVPSSKNKKQSEKVKEIKLFFQSSLFPFKFISSSSKLGCCLSQFDH